MLATSMQCENKKWLNNDTTIAAGFGIQAKKGWSDPKMLNRILPVWQKNNVRVIVLERRNEVAHSLHHVELPKVTRLK